jgi:transcriptional regulator with XRE-family HTH domain
VRLANPERVLGLIGRRLAELRTARELTQEQLAERAEVSARYIQRVEAGTENLTVRTLIKMSNALRISLAELLVAPLAPRARPGRPQRARQ